MLLHRFVVAGCTRQKVSVDPSAVAPRMRSRSVDEVADPVLPSLAANFPASSSGRPSPTGACDRATSSSTGAASSAGTRTYVNVGGIVSSKLLLRLALGVFKLAAVCLLPHVHAHCGNRQPAQSASKIKIIKTHFAIGCSDWKWRGFGRPHPSVWWLPQHTRVKAQGPIPTCPPSWEKSQG